MYKKITVADFADVIYTSGRVFDNLQSSRLGTEQFLRTGNTNGIRSKADLALLEDLRDAAELVINKPRKVIDAEYLVSINSKITRSGALSPGKLRRDDQQIGVSTVYGRHEPPAQTIGTLNSLCKKSSILARTPEEHAISLFIDVARAQPFEDGNKRTALLAANSLLIANESDYLLTAPHSDDDPTVTREFTDSLARAYVFRSDDDAIASLNTYGLRPLDTTYSAPKTTNQEFNA